MTRIAAGAALFWAVVELAWSLYSLSVVGIGTFLKAVFFYGSHDGTANADVNSLVYGLLYAAAALLLLRGAGWARGTLIGLVMVQGYNLTRSLTGALLDPAQRAWYTSATLGGFRLVSYCVGLVVVFTILVLSLRELREAATRTPWQPTPNAWTEAASAVRQGQGYGQGPGGWSAQPGVPAAPPQQQPYYGAPAVPPQQPQPVQPQPVQQQPVQQNPVQQNPYAPQYPQPTDGSVHDHGTVSFRPAPPNQGPGGNQ